MEATPPLIPTRPSEVTVETESTLAETTEASSWTRAPMSTEAREATETTAEPEETEAQVSDLERVSILEPRAHRSVLLRDQTSPEETEAQAVTTEIPTPPADLVVLVSTQVARSLSTTPIFPEETEATVPEPMKTLAETTVETEGPVSSEETTSLSPGIPRSPAAREETDPLTEPMAEPAAREGTESRLRPEAKTTRSLSPTAPSPLATEAMEEIPPPEQEETEVPEGPESPQTTPT